LIFRKYPNYIEMVKSNPETSIFKKQELQKLNAHEDFKYCLITSFDFIEKNNPQVFRGEF
jgi:hypothetical protein